MKYTREEFVQKMMESNDDVIAEFTGITDHDFIYAAEKQGVLGDIIASAYDKKSPEEIQRYEEGLT